MSYSANKRAKYMKKIKKNEDAIRSAGVMLIGYTRIPKSNVVK